MGAPMNEEQLRMIARYRANGMTTKAIATRMGITDRTVRTWLKKGDVKELIERERVAVEWGMEEARRGLFRLGWKSVSILRDVLEDAQHPQRLSTAKYVLDKMIPAQRVEANAEAREAVMDDESRRLLREAFMGIAQGMAVMAERGQIATGVDRVRKGPEALLRPAMVVEVEAERGSGV